MGNREQQSIRYPNQKSKDKKEKRLAIFVGMMRQTYKGMGTCHLLSKDEIKLLESIPGWKWEDRKNITRLQRIEKLKKWVIKNKKNPHHKENKEIYRILKLIRLAKSGAKGNSLSKDEIKLCESIPNWKWYEDYENKRIKKINELKKWVIKNKKNPSKHYKDEKKLYEFKRILRRIYKGMINKNKFMKYRDLSKDEIKLCESIPNWKW